MFSPSFVIALAFLLGHYMAGTLTGKSKFKVQMMNAYLNASLIAAAADQNEQVDRKPRDADWIRGRE